MRSWIQRRIAGTKELERATATKAEELRVARKVGIGIVVGGRFVETKPLSCCDMYRQTPLSASAAVSKRRKAVVSSAVQVAAVGGVT